MRITSAIRAGLKEKSWGVFWRRLRGKISVDDILPVIRREIPRLGGKELFMEWPIVPRHLRYIKTKRMVITGGWCHGMLEGWFFKPCVLQIETVVTSNEEFGIIWVEKVDIIERRPETEHELPEDIRKVWEARCTDYNALPEEQKY